MQRFWRGRIKGDLDQEEVDEAEDEAEINTTGPAGHGNQLSVSHAERMVEENQLMGNMVWSFDQSLHASTIDPFRSLAWDTKQNRVIPMLTHHCKIMALC